MIATRLIKSAIKENRSARFLYRGITTDPGLPGYAPNAQFEIWDDTELQKTWHILVTTEYKCIICGNPAACDQAILCHSCRETKCHEFFAQLGGSDE